MADQVLSPAELGNLLVTILTGVAGGDEARWRELVGTVEKLPLAFHPRSNWTIVRVGSATEQDAIARAIDVVREQHPYVT